MPTARKKRSGRGGDLLTLAEVSKLFGVSRRTIYRRIEDGLLEHGYGPPRILLDRSGKTVRRRYCPPMLMFRRSDVARAFRVNA